MPPDPDSGVRPSVYVAWVMFAISLVLPSVLGIPVYGFVAATAMSVASAFSGGDVAHLYAALLFIPNIAMLLSPLLLSARIRRGFGLLLLRVAGVAGALIAVVSTAFLSIFVGSCGGLQSGGGILGVGAYLWTLSVVVLAVALVRTRTAR